MKDSMKGLAMARRRRDGPAGREPAVLVVDDEGDTAERIRDTLRSAEAKRHLPAPPPQGQASL